MTEVLGPTEHDRPIPRHHAAQAVGDDVGPVGAEP